MPEELQSIDGVAEIIMNSLFVKALAVLILVLAIGPLAFGQSDISGVWNRLGGLRTLSDPAPPMTPAAQAKYKESKPGYDLPSDKRSVPPAKGNDPAGRCDPLGLVRSLYAFRPVEFVVTPNRIFQFFEWNHIWRTIWTDGRKLPEDPDATWYGYSVGHWEGDTLVVDVTGFNDRTWLDAAGHPHTEKLHVIERYTRESEDSLHYEVTIDDPGAYSKPWSAGWHVRWQAGWEPYEYICQENNKDVVIENHMVGLKPGEKHP